MPDRHLLSPKEASSSRIMLHLIMLFAQGFPWAPNNSGYCQDYRLFTNWEQDPIPEDDTHRTHWIRFLKSYKCLLPLTGTTKYPLPFLVKQHVRKLSEELHLYVKNHIVNSWVNLYFNRVSICKENTSCYCEIDRALPRDQFYSIFSVIILGNQGRTLQKLINTFWYPEILSLPDRW